MSPESARAGNRAEKSKYVTCNSMQPHAAGQLTLDIGQQRSCSILRRVERRGFAENDGIHIEQLPRLLIRRSTHHHSVQRTERISRLVERRDATVEYDLKIRIRRLESTDNRIVKWRYFTILAW